MPFVTRGFPVPKSPNIKKNRHNLRIVNAPGSSRDVRNQARRAVSKIRLRGGGQITYCVRYGKTVIRGFVTSDGRCDHGHLHFYPENRPLARPGKSGQKQRKEDSENRNDNQSLDQRERSVSAGP